MDIQQRLEDDATTNETLNFETSHSRAVLSKKLSWRFSKSQDGGRWGMKRFMRLCLVNPADDNRLLSNGNTTNTNTQS